jgi:nucleotide-binding universal stress UspA family protein
MDDRYYVLALEDYKQARRQAAVEELLGRITGTNDKNRLLSYEDVRRKLLAIEKSSQHLAEIPLDSIVGSVDRYHDFTRRYLPRKSINRGRWAKVMSYAKGLTGLPPIEVYQIGQVYFVKDGNHRVSVARRLGNKTIQAYVTEVEVRVEITPDLEPDDLIIKAEYVRFLEKTKLDKLRPDADLTATAAGAYPTILEHINVHRYFMGLDQQRDIPYEEAVTHWYDFVYLPVIQTIHSRRLLRDFPDRTETDLYLWIARHRTELEQEIGWQVDSDDAINDLAEQHGFSAFRIWNRFVSSTLNWLTPDLLEIGPPPGTWRKKRHADSDQSQIFQDILVAVDDTGNTWCSLDQAIQVARNESGRLHGIHVHPKNDSIHSEQHLSLEDEFTRRCQESEIDSFDFQVAQGEVGKTLCKQARFADLVVLPLNHPPGEKKLERLGSGLRQLIRSCPLPIMTVRGQSTPMEHPVVAYDGSPKSKEALYIASYLAGQWQTELTVITSAVGLTNPELVFREAQKYLRSVHLEAQIIQTDQHVVEKIQEGFKSGKYDLVLIGGYGSRPVLEVVLGSVVDRLLREVPLPTIICR